MSEPRYIRHGSFGVRGKRVRLLQSRATGNFVIDIGSAHFYGAGRHCNLDTTDLEEAKKKVQVFLQNGKPAPRGDWVLYVIQRGENGPIKVGISRNVKSRLGSLQSANAEKLKVIRVYKMADVERAVHAELGKVSRLEGEWFPADLLSLVDHFFSVLPLHPIEAELSHE